MDEQARRELEDPAWHLLYHGKKPLTIALKSLIHELLVSTPCQNCNRRPANYAGTNWGFMCRVCRMEKEQNAA